MKIFNVNKRIQIVCDTLPTRIAFKHVAHLFIDGNDRTWQKECKICYQNRTWERYTYESVLYKVAETPGIEPKDQKAIIKFVKNYN